MDAVRLRNELSTTAVRVFVSSTFQDLQPERKAVEDILQRFRTTKFIGMEYFGSRDSDTLGASINEVDGCDLYIGLIGHRFGSGITEAEYRRARGNKTPCLIYLATGPSNDSQLLAFRDELRQSHTVTEFRSPDELAALVAADLHNWLVDHWLTPRFIQGSLDGIAALGADYSGRIQNFLVEYLGTERHPVPFGGRTVELSALDAWLCSPKSQPYALIAAPADAANPHSLRAGPAPLRAVQTSISSSYRSASGFARTLPRWYLHPWRLVLPESLERTSALPRIHHRCVAWYRLFVSAP